MPWWSLWWKKLVLIQVWPSCASDHWSAAPLLLLGLVGSCYNMSSLGTALTYLPYTVQSRQSWAVADTCQHWLSRAKANFSSQNLEKSSNKDNHFFLSQIIGHLAISPMRLQRLFSVPESNLRFRGQNQWPSSWGRSQTVLAMVGRARSNTGRFQLGSSSWQRQARLRKICYHSCDTDSVQESTRFWCL